MSSASPDGLKRSFKITCNNVKISGGSKIKNGIIFDDIRRTVKTSMTVTGLDKAHRDVILVHSMQGMDLHYIVPPEDTLSRRWLDTLKGLTARLQKPPQMLTILLTK